jgi:hypothetical protein
MHAVLCCSVLWCCNNGKAAEPTNPPLLGELLEGKSVQLLCVAGCADQGPGQRWDVALRGIICRRVVQRRVVQRRVLHVTAEHPDMRGSGSAGSR